MGALRVTGVAAFVTPAYSSVPMDRGSIRKVVGQRDAPKHHEASVVTGGAAEAAVVHGHGGVTLKKLLIGRFKPRFRFADRVAVLGM